ncbi:MAG TPA: IS21 family transposase [Gemmataceae bacterium]|nr:IS21 family transposase [Gemmataceae bacterium]
MYADMELWAEIRRRVLTGELSKRQACRTYEIHWATLKKILAHEEPPGYRRRQPRRRPTIEPVLPVIRQILTDDASAPKKQRHTAQRIWQRLRDEHAFTGGYTTVKDAVRELKVGTKEVFLPLTHPPGEAQVDFGFAEVILAGAPTQVAVFVMSLPYSDAVYCQAFPRECTEVFLEGHVRAFGFFGGVPRRIAYDNTKTAVAKIVGSRDRVLTREFARLMSHFLFASHFCLVRRPNEKGHVERLVEYARSNFLVPVPRVGSLAELNERLTAQCLQDQGRTTRGKPGTVGALLVEDRAAMLALPAKGFEPRRVAEVAADSLSLVRFDTNSYSVPTKYAHRTLTVVGTVDEVRIVFEDRLVARHPRCWDREQYHFDPIHYLALLERKPGGFDFARPLEDWALPECFGVLRRRLEAEAADGVGTRGFIRVLRLLETYSLAQLSDAVESALAIDVTDPDSIRVILDHRADCPVPVFSLDGRPHLAGVRVPVTDVAAYGVLLAGEGTR